MHEDQFSVVSGQSIVHHYLHPLAVLPEIEAEDARVTIAKTLIGGHDVTEKAWVDTKAANSRQQPAIA